MRASDWGEYHGTVAGLWLLLCFLCVRLEGRERLEEQISKGCHLKRLVRRQEVKNSRERANKEDGSALGFLTLGVLAYLSL